MTVAGEKFDVVIIGAGISGLTAASLLAKNGIKVCVLEKHNIIGGYLQGFERKEFVFDTAIHWLNQCGEQGTVTKIFRYLGDDFPKPQLMEKIQRHVGNHHDYTLTNQPDRLKEQLIKDFPEERKGIEKFFREAKKIAKTSLKFSKLFRSPETMNVWEIIGLRLRQMFIGFPLLKHIWYHGEEGMKKGLGKYFKDPDLQKLWCAERDLLSCLFPIAWAYNSDYQNPPVGGSQAFVKWLNEKFESYQSGQVQLSAKVIRINIENDRFQSVTFTNKGKEYEVFGDYLIAACDVEKLYEHLIPKKHAPVSLLQNLKNAELYSSSVTLSIALDCKAEALGFGKDLILICNDDLSRDDQSSGDPHKTAISVLAPSTRDHTLCPPENGTLTVYVPAWMDYENYWRTGGLQENGEYKRTPEYKALKEEFAEIILSRVEQKLNCSLREHILFCEISTPITYYRYTHNRNGSMMGARPGKHNMQSKVAHYQTEIDNIVLGGQWAELGGGVPIATKAAYNASLLLLKKMNHKSFDTLKTILS